MMPLLILSGVAVWSALLLACWPVAALVLIVAAPPVIAGRLVAAHVVGAGGASMRTVAALYIDPRGPYPSMPGVECWDESRDARTYAGPHPVVAHPPCGPWGRLRHLYRGNEHDRAPAAVGAVREWGGVLEHPANSLLWSACRMPCPDELPDEHGGITIAVNQVEWGHPCVKPTWLYLVGVHDAKIASPYPGRRPTHGIWYGDFVRAGRAGPKLLGASKEKRRRTPPAFAAWLVELARASRRDQAQIARAG